MRITKDFLKSLSPCQSRWINYLKHYSTFSGSLLDFLNLDKITPVDKLWVFTRKIEDPKIERLQRMFAVRCAVRAVEKVNVEELTEFLQLVIIMYQSVNYETGIEHLKDDDYKATYCAAHNGAGCAAYKAVYWAACYEACSAVAWAADYAAYWEAGSVAVAAVERKAQLEMLKQLIREEGE